MMSLSSESFVCFPDLLLCIYFVKKSPCPLLPFFSIIISCSYSSRTFSFTNLALVITSHFWTSFCVSMIYTNKNKRRVTWNHLEPGEEGSETITLFHGVEYGYISMVWRENTDIHLSSGANKTLLERKISHLECKLLLRGHRPNYFNLLASFWDFYVPMMHTNTNKEKIRLHFWKKDRGRLHRAHKTRFSVILGDERSRTIPLLHWILMWVYKCGRKSETQYTTMKWHLPRKHDFLGWISHFVLKSHFEATNSNLVIIWLFFWNFHVLRTYANTNK
jgi:hypothetical protein